MRRRRDDDLPDSGFAAWGGYMQAKIAKLEEQFDVRSANDRESDIFCGISIYVNGYTKPSADELKMLMSRHGGVYHTYQRSDDIVIASNLPDTKVKRLTTAKVVRPEWITESLAAGNLLDYKDYLLYSRHTRTQPKLHFEIVKTSKATAKASDHTEQNLKEEDYRVHSIQTGINTEESAMIDSNNCCFLKSHSVALNPEDILSTHKEMYLPPLEVATKELKYSDATSKSSGSDIPPKEIPSSILLEESNKSEIILTDMEKDISLPPNRVLTTRSITLMSENSLNDNDVVLLNPNETNPIKQSARESDSARTAVDPKFLSEFYNNSRLHHISQLGAGFKQYVNELRDTSDFKFPARCKFKEMISSMPPQSELPTRSDSFKGGKAIMHIDMDCFFVSVGLRNRPELRGEPVAVTHAKNTQHKPQKRLGENREAEFNLYRLKKARALAKATGISEYSQLGEDMIKTPLDDLDEEEGDRYISLSEIASCSYEARANGIRNGMFMGAALKLCPGLKTMPYDFDSYKEVAYTLYNTVAQYTLDIEAVSCDEMYVDCTELIASLNITVEQFASALRQEIRSKTGCPCSTGFGGNRLQARLATKRAKPDGQFFLTSHLVDNFMMDVKLEDLPGVGRQLQQRLTALCSDSSATCRALQTHSLVSLQKQLGVSVGRQLYYYCRGDDQRPLAFVTVRKSVSAEVNYGIRFENQIQCDTFLKQLCCEVHDRMKTSKVTGKSITLKLMIRAKDAPVETAKFMGHGFCDTINKTTTLQMATDNLEIITREVLQLCKKQKCDPKEMRGIGIQITKLVSTARQQSKNPIKAFLLRPESKVPQNTNKEINSKNVVAKNVTKPSHMVIKTYDEQDTFKNAIENNVAPWVLRTPPKRHNVINISENKDKTPVKCTHIRYPVVVIRSPVKSPQKTPPKKKCLGLTGRRRGRPPKNSASNVQMKLSASKVVMSKFLRGESSKADSNTIERFDPEILAALPEDIRQEVLEYYQLSAPPGEYSRSKTPQEEIKTKLAENKTEPSNSLQITPQKERAESPKPQHDSNVMLDIFNVPWQQVKEMLRAWLQAGCVPLECDVELMSTYMQNMVIHRNIDKLIILINFLRRSISDMGDTGWSHVYDHILEGIQQTMLAVYGKTLLVD